MNAELKRAIGVLKDYRKGDFVGDTDLCEAIDTVVNEICDHNFLPIGEWDGVMMLQCTKCNLYKEGEGKKTCVHPYAFVYGGCGKVERCLKCGEILSD